MAYAENTTVPFERSINEIIGAVRKAGAEQIGQFEDTQWFAIQFTIANRMIRFRVPFPSLADMPTHNGRQQPFSPQQRADRLDQARRQRGRALMLVIKAKLESVESGIETVEQAFLANVVLSDGQTLYERVGGSIAIEYKQARPVAGIGLLEAPRP